ncbi:MAG: DUF2948 family protein [Rhizobiaceae bacterium]
MDRLKLVALDEEDLAIISAHCQDAVLKAADARYLPRERRFILPMNRFVWEKPGGSGKYERRRAVLHFERVMKVSSTGFDRKRKDQVLSLLAVTFSETDKPAGHIEIVFSGGAAIRLEAEVIEAQLSDMNAAWETGSRPEHDEAEKLS